MVTFSATFKNQYFQEELHILIHADATEKNEYYRLEATIGGLVFRSNNFVRWFPDDPESAYRQNSSWYEEGDDPNQFFDENQDEASLFELAKFEMDVEFSVVLITPAGEVPTQLRKKVRAKESLDRAEQWLELRYEGKWIDSIKQDGLKKSFFEESAHALQIKLPTDTYLKACFNCRLCSIGWAESGVQFATGWNCYREVATEYLQLRAEHPNKMGCAKAGRFSDQIQYVHALDICEQFTGYKMSMAYGWSPDLDD